MRLKIEHETRYRFDAPVPFGVQQLKKTPKSSHQQLVLNWETEIEGGAKQLAFEDHHLNIVELIGFEKGITELVITSRGEVEITDNHGVVGAHRGGAPLWLYLRQTPLTKPGVGVRALIKETSALKTSGDLETLHALVGQIREAVRYESGVSHPEWDAEEVVRQGLGVCQDHTHVFLAAAREMGYPARYVSGYLMLDDRVEQDAMHAWAEAHVDGLGWVGFDVSNGISPDMRYVRVATGLDYTEAAPITGRRTGMAGETLAVDLTVTQQ